MDLSALESFNLVIAHGGLGRASRATGRPKATLSRHLTELELSLGVRLIERGGRSLRVTDAGRTLHDQTSGLLAELKEAGKAAASNALVPRGPLRISAPMLLAHVVLAKVSAQFALAYPDIRLEIVAEDRKVDLIDEGYDLVFRVDPSTDERLAGRIILHDHRVLVASPEMRLPNRKSKTTIEEPLKAVLSSSTPEGTNWKVRIDSKSVRTFVPEPILRLSTLLMVREAVLAKAGAAMLPHLLVADDIRAGRLLCWGNEEGRSVEIWALYSSRRLLSIKVRKYLEALIEAFPDKSFAG